MNENSLPANIPDPIDARRAQRPQQAQIGITVEKKMAGFSGPIPPPSLLAEYEQGFEGSADRIIKMAEKALEHRHSMEQQIVASQIADSTASHTAAKRGQLCALIVVLASLAGGVWTATTGHEFAAAVIGGTGITGVVTAFLADRRRGRIEEDEKLREQASVDSQSTPPSRKKKKNT